MRHERLKFHLDEVVRILEEEGATIALALRDSKRLRGLFGPLLDDGLGNVQDGGEFVVREGSELSQ